MVKYRIEINHDVCRGFGACVELCSLFSLTEKGKSQIQGGKKILKDGITTEILEIDELKCIEEAAKACPFNAIHIMNLETKEKIV